MNKKDHVDIVECYILKQQVMRQEIDYLTDRIKALESVLTEIINRWDSPKWKDSGTADIIGQARKTLASNKG
jgi:hypothetical protein